jgi:hypothetical protein
MQSQYDPDMAWPELGEKLRRIPKISAFGGPGAMGRSALGGGAVLQVLAVFDRG